MVDCGWSWYILADLYWCRVVNNIGYLNHPDHLDHIEHLDILDHLDHLNNFDQLVHLHCHDHPD